MMEDYETINKNRGSYYQARVKDVCERIHKIVEEPGIQPHDCVEADGWFVRGLAVFVDDLERRVERLEMEAKNKNKVKNDT
jgi:hypothetical protein